MMEFSDEELSKVRDYITAKLDAGKDRVKTGNVFHNVKLKNFSEESHFRQAMSQAFVADRLPGLFSQRGRYGGIKRGIKPEPPKKVQPAKVEKPEPLVVPTIVEPVIELKPEPESLVVLQRPRPSYRASTFKRPTERTAIMIGERKFMVTMTSMEFCGFMKHVIQAKETEEEHNVSGYGSKYQLTDEQLGLLDRLLFYCFKASIVAASAIAEVA